jgi:hypothetical protein
MSGDALRRGAAAAVLTAGALAIGASAGSGQGMTQASSSVSGSPVSPAGKVPHGELMREARRQAEAMALEAAQERRLREEPSRVASRERSRQQFSGLSRGEAARLAAQRFSSFVETPAAGPLSSGRVADEYVGAYAARLENAAPGGEDAFVVAGHPLRAEDGKGELAPVDVSLQRYGTGWSPVNPLEPYVIAADGAVRFSESGLAVAPSDAEVPGETVGETLFFSETADDTDTLVKPRVDGVQYAWQLRSTDSPQELELEVDLPDGAKLIGDGEGAQIVQSGAVVGRISAPIAFDADGRLLDATLHIMSGRAVVRVEHRGADVAYPILVDPNVTADFDFPAGAAAYGDWGNYEHPAEKFDLVTGSFGWGTGLHVTSPNWPHVFPQYSAGTGPADADRAGWYYNAPGQARIIRAYASRLTHSQGRFLNDCLIMGITNATLSGWEGPHGTGWGENCGSMNSHAWTVYSPGTPGNAVLFGDYIYSNTPTGADSNLNAFMQDVEITMVDDDLPGISSFGVPNGWTNGTNGAAVNVLAGDYSTGIKNINVVGPSTWNGTGTSTNPNCAYGPCSKTYSVSRPIGNMPEGTHTITVSATDPSGNATPVATRTLRVDRTPPYFALGGLVHAMRTTTDVDNGTSIGGFFNATEASLVAKTMDARSGVKGVTVSVDGVTVAQRDGNDCTATQCPAEATLTVTLNKDHLGVGDHEVVVEGRDMAGNSVTESFTLFVPPPQEPITDDATATLPLPDVAPAAQCPANPLYPNDPTYCEFPDPATNDSMAAAEQEPEMGTQQEGPVLLGSDPDQEQSDPVSAAHRGGNVRSCAATNPPKVIGAKRTNEAPGWGLSDSKAFTPLDGDTMVGRNIWSDPVDKQYIDALKMKRVRIVLPYDIVSDGLDAGRDTEACWLLHRVARWIQDRETAGQQVFVSFEHRQVPGWVGDNPQTAVREGKALYATEAQLPEVRTGLNDVSANDEAKLDSYSEAVSEFMAQFPVVRYYSAWNEPNFSTNQPTSDRPGMAAKYWVELNKLCKAGKGSKCTVAAGEFIDVQSLEASRSGQAWWYLYQYYTGIGQRDVKIWAFQSLHLDA